MRRVLPSAGPAHEHLTVKRVHSVARKTAVFVTLGATLVLVAFVARLGVQAASSEQSAKSSEHATTESTRTPRAQGVAAPESSGKVEFRQAEQQTRYVRAIREGRGRAIAQLDQLIEAAKQRGDDGSAQLTRLEALRDRLRQELSGVEASTP